MPEIEFALMADRADYVAGKLYLAGGCWDRVQVQRGHAHILSFAVSLKVLPDEADTQHTIHIAIGALGEPPRAQVAAQFVADRPNDLGLPFQRAILTVPTLSVTFPESGQYWLATSIVGVADREYRIPFHVQVLPPPLDDRPDAPGQAASSVPPTATPRAIAGSDAPSAVAPSSGTPHAQADTPPDDAASFVRAVLTRPALTVSQTALLRALYAAPTGVLRYSELVATLGCSPQQLNGFLGTLGRRAVATSGGGARRNIDALIHISGPGPDWTYRLLPETRAICEELGIAP